MDCTLKANFYISIGESTEFERYNPLRVALGICFESSAAYCGYGYTDGKCKRSCMVHDVYWWCKVFGK